MSKHAGYRRDIDGLRAIAVLLVIGFHAFPRQITGGYIGVDIFFVISGFLITGLILHDLEKKQFSFSVFYARRIRRIFPALAAVLAVCFAAGWVFLLPRGFTSLGINVFGGAAFSSNFVLLGETGYFDLSAAQKPLLHLWSLGVEEQFYIVWPVLLLLTFSRRVSIVVLALTLLIISFAWNVKDAGAASAFYLPLTRAWELMIGGLMAAVASPSDYFRLVRAFGSTQSYLKGMIPTPVTASYSYPDVRALVGVTLITAAVVVLDKDSLFPGWWALLPTLGTALIISAHRAWFNRKILSNPIAVWVGLISYPLYLWHWPLLSFVNVIHPEPSRGLRVAAIVAAIALAWITFRWIERPIRTGQRSPFKIAAPCVAMALVGGAGLATFYWQGFPDRIPPAIRSIDSVKLTVDFEQSVWRLHTCLLESGDTKSQFTPDCIERGHRPLLFLWGDSFAAAFYPGLKQLQQTHDFGLAQYTTAGCPPVLFLVVQARPHCMENNDFVFSVLRDARPDIVLLYSAWAPAYGDFMPNLTDLIAKLRLLKIPRIIIMGPPPAWGGGLPQAVYAYYQLSPLHRMIPTRSSFRVSGYLYQQEFRNKILSLGTEYISAWDALCNGEECLTRLGNSAAELTAFDEAHLTVPGAINLAKTIASCLFPEQEGRSDLMASNGTERSRVCYQPND